jgi:hypothetical protein
MEELRKCLLGADCVEKVGVADEFALDAKE